MPYHRPTIFDIELVSKEHSVNLPANKMLFIGNPFTPATGNEVQCPYIPQSTVSLTFFLTYKCNTSPSVLIHCSCVVKPYLILPMNNYKADIQNATTGTQKLEKNTTQQNCFNSVLAVLKLLFALVTKGL